MAGVEGMGRQRILYLTRTGLLEPLGQSQVLRYLQGLARDFAITVISFERAGDLADAASIAEIRRLCDAHGIRWLPQRYSGQSQSKDALRDIGRMVRIGWREHRNGGIALIHARSYLPALAAAFLGRALRVPYIFDMRALWPEELITSGRLRRGSRMHRILVRAERLCIRRSAAVVSLTHAGVHYLMGKHPEAMRGRDVAIIPTCVDLRLFVPEPGGAEPLVYGCVGSVTSGWFRLDWLASFFKLVSRRENSALFEVITRDDPHLVREALLRAGVPGERLAVYASAPAGVPACIRKQKVNIMFYNGGAVSELGRSPTRLAEVLACGVPVIANRGVGDVAEVLESEEVGIVAENGSPETLEAAYEAFLARRGEAGLSERCRRAAERVYSLEAGVQAYRRLYLRHMAAPKAGKVLPS